MEYSLGYFPTKAEAEAVEARFDERWPPYEGLITNGRWVGRKARQRERKARGT